jgi:hypothetical protein
MSSHTNVCHPVATCLAFPEEDSGSIVPRGLATAESLHLCWQITVVPHHYSDIPAQVVADGNETKPAHPGDIGSNIVRERVMPRFTTT